jgi:hypothetical protein
MAGLIREILFIDKETKGPFIREIKLAPINFYPVYKIASLVLRNKELPIKCIRLLLIVRVLTCAYVCAPHS